MQLLPRTQVADKAIGVFEGTLSTTSTGAEKLAFAQTFTGSDSKLSYGLAVAATPTSVFLDASPLPPAAAKGQVGTGAVTFVQHLAMLPHAAIPHVNAKAAQLDTLCLRTAGHGCTCAAEWRH